MLLGTEGFPAAMPYAIQLSQIKNASTVGPGSLRGHLGPLQSLEVSSRIDLFE